MHLQPNNKLGATPIIIAVLCPVIGLIMGIATCATNTNKGAKLIAWSFAAGFAWFCVSMMWLGGIIGG